MREIKFRVWDKTQCRMFIPDGLKNPINFTENVEHMQFTGLHDKNGKEIYEGDVVRGFDENEFGSVNNDGPVHAKVIWWENSAGFQLEAISPSEILHSDMAVNVEIIGNIYEHPELLTNK